MQRRFETFTNEFGNRIKITVSTDKDSISLKIEGPTSVGEQILTPMEAKILAGMLRIATKPAVFMPELGESKDSQ